MSIKIAVNGFGRIGRCVVRALYEEQKEYADLELTAINSPAPIETQAHLLKYDSVHGRFETDMEVFEDRIRLNKADDIRIYHERDPIALPWNDLEVDVVLECSGFFKKREDAAKHNHAGAKRTIISAPAPDPDMTAVYGVNHTDFTPEMTVISAGSCTTNCLAPLAKLLHSNFGIKEGYMTTIHAYTGDQNLVDGSHKDLRRARAAGASMVPTSTGAAKALKEVLPELAGKLQGTAIRVPSANVSMVDLCCVTENDISPEAFHKAVEAASAEEMHNVIGIHYDPLVSCDLNHTVQSCIVDATATACVSPRFVRAAAWYDNEWAFSLRMLDLARYVGSR